MDQLYWKKFYKEIGLYPKLPSQFSAFCINELNEVYFLNKPKPIIFEIGCGDGRDAEYFASFGYTVIAIDQNLQAVKNKKQTKNLVFEKIDNFKTLEELIENRRRSGNIVIYNRFFFHAINEYEQNDLLQILSFILRKGDIIMSEFRTDKDQDRTKVTPKHYRRYIKLKEFIVSVVSAGFEILYSVEGLGMAKFRDDDAYVARLIIQKK